MPDWIVHIGSTFILLKLFKIRDIRWFFLGAVLPDTITMVAYVIMDHGTLILNLDPNFCHIYLHMFHSPFMMMITACIIALFSERFIFVSIAITSGSFLHIFIDIFQKSAGGGTVTLYPFYIDNYIFDIYWYPSIFTNILIMASMIFLTYFFIKEKKKYETVRLKFKNNKKILLVPIFLGALLLLPYLTYEKALENNVNNVAFTSNPEKFENKVVSIAVSEVIEPGNPFTASEGSATFKIENISNFDFKTGDWISAKGIYSNKTIKPFYLHRHKYHFKIITSLIGLIIFLIFWFIYPAYKKD